LDQGPGKILEQMLRSVEPFRDRPDFSFGEFPRHVLDAELLLGQLEVDHLNLLLRNRNKKNCIGWRGSRAKLDVSISISTGRSIPLPQNLHRRLPASRVPQCYQLGGVTRWRELFLLPNERNDLMPVVDSGCDIDQM
jgi:hypothetical protein